LTGRANRRASRVFELISESASMTAMDEIGAPSPERAARA
jgi:hypothetical protein